MARVELGDITEITQIELKQIFNGGVIVRPRVERSFLTTDAKTSLTPGIAQTLIHVERSPSHP